MLAEKWERPASPTPTTADPPAGAASGRSTRDSFTRDSSTRTGEAGQRGSSAGEGPSNDVHPSASPSPPVGPAQTQVKELAEIFRGRIVDVAADSVVVEISGTEKKIEGFIELVRPLGIMELVRTGRIAMVRGSPPTRELTEAADGARPADSSPEHDSLT
jgi:hypothetical protein